MKQMLLLAALSAAVSAEIVKDTIAGTVYHSATQCLSSATNSVLPHASVTLKLSDTTFTTTTDNNGKFSILLSRLPNMDLHDVF